MWGVDPYGRDWLLRILVVIWLLILLGLAAIAARAQDAHAAVSNPSVTTDGMLYAAVAVADDFWADHGARAAKAEVYEYDETDGKSIARGELPGDAVLFDRRWLRRMRALLRKPWGTRWRRLVVQQVCMVAIHERGHNLGLPHEPGRSLMHAETGHHPVVGRCRAWSLRAYPAGG